MASTSVVGSDDDGGGDASFDLEDANERADSSNDGCDTISLYPGRKYHRLSSPHTIKSVFPGTSGGPSSDR
jgi:hypothetical protein